MRVRRIVFPGDTANWVLLQRLLCDLHSRCISTYCELKEVVLRHQEIYDVAASHPAQGYGRCPFNKCVLYPLYRYMEDVARETEKQQFIYQTLPTILQYTLHVAVNAPKDGLCIVEQQTEYKSIRTKIRARSNPTKPIYTTPSGTGKRFSGKKSARIESHGGKSWIVTKPHRTGYLTVAEPYHIPTANLPIVPEPYHIPTANLPIVPEPYHIPTANLPIVPEPYHIPTANLPIVAEYIANLPTHSDAESLYPSTNHPWDTRVFKQLTYVPKHITGIKKIYVEFRGFTKKIKLNSVGQFKDWRCRVDQCTIMSQYTGQESDIVDADIVLLKQSIWKKPSKMIMDVFEKKRRPGQIWALVTTETQMHTRNLFKGHTYNWTVSTTPSSPIHVNFGSAFQISPNVSTLPQTRNWAANKSKLIIGIVSNCKPTNARDKYYKKLAKYIQLDIFGKCGKVIPNCITKHWHTQCARKMIPAYKFYLAFENHNCDTYVTEKPFINALRNDVIPIVMGPPRAFASHVFPTNSYIHVEDFTSAKDLAEYLHKVAKNDTLYNSYFQWKGAWAIREHDDEIFGDFDDIPPYNAFCRVCALLHAPSREMVTTIGEWKQIETCRPPIYPGP